MVEFKNILYDKSAVPGAMEHNFISCPGTHSTLVSPLKSFVGFNLRQAKAIRLLESAPCLNFSMRLVFHFPHVHLALKGPRHLLQGFLQLPVPLT